MVFIPLLKGIHETQQESILVAEFAIPFHPYMFHIDWVSFGSFFVAENCCWKDVIYLNMTFEEASKFIVSAGTSSGKS